MNINVARKIFGLLGAVVLMGSLLLPQTAFAQTELPRTELSLSLRDADNEFFNSETVAEQDNKFFLEVRNVGNTTITNITLSVEEPEGWLIVITPSAISTLNAGSLFTCDVNIRPTGGATAQGRQVRFTAEANEIQRRIETFFITVRPAQSWIWVWIAAGATLVAVFAFIYMRLNKQG